MKIQFVRSKELILTTHAGLATVGALLAHTKLSKRLNHTVVKDVEHPIHSHADVMKSPLGTMLANSTVTQTFAPESVPAGYREAVLSLWLRPGQFRANREDILAFPPAAGQAAKLYGQIQCPVVIIVGEDDPFGTIEHAVRLQDDIPHARLMVVPNIGHMIPQHHPDLVMQAVDAHFLVLWPRTGKGDGG